MNHKYRIKVCTLTGMFLLLSIVQSQAQNIRNSRYKAVAFDYLVVFDPNSLAPEVESVFPGKGLEVVKHWRNKQFEYCFLRSITNNYVDFFTITGDALDYTAAEMQLQLTTEARARLMDAYLHLKPWPDSVEALKKLKAAGIRIIALSNFSPAMLQANAKNAGIADLFDELVSTEAVQSFKPDLRTYQLALDRVHLQKKEVVFAAFGGWDAYGAKRFGFPTVWINRFSLPTENLGSSPDRTSANIDGLVDFVLGQRHE